MSFYTLLYIFKVLCYLAKYSILFSCYLNPCKMGVIRYLSESYYGALVKMSLWNIYIGRKLRILCEWNVKWINLPWPPTWHCRSAPSLKEWLWNSDLGSWFCPELQCFEIYNSFEHTVVQNSVFENRISGAYFVNSL